MSTRETGSLDPLDAGLRRRAPPTRLRAVELLLRTRAALGLEPLTAPAVVFVPIGVLLGPHALGLVTPSLIGHLEPVLAVALAALGVFVGTALDVRTRGTRRLFAAASLESLITVAVVGSASWFVLNRWALATETDVVLVAWMLAAAAAVSAAGVPDEGAGAAERLATRVADLDDAGAVVVGAVVAATIAGESPGAAARSVLLTIVVGLLAGLAGWLLFERARSAAERGVFVLGSLALLGGAADYVRCSPLLAGMVAGLAWALLPGHADSIVRTDVGRFQHPLVLLLLISAGVLIDVTMLAIWLLAPFVVFRLTGKVMGAWVAARVLPLSAGQLAGYLVPPGLLGIALAINFLQISATPTAAAVATAVALGTFLSEVLALVALPGTRQDTED
jgi:hypothetical protein